MSNQQEKSIDRGYQFNVKLGSKASMLNRIWGDSWKKWSCHKNVSGKEDRVWISDPGFRHALLRCPETSKWKQLQPGRNTSLELMERWGWIHGIEEQGWVHTGRQRDQEPTGDRLPSGGQEAKNGIAKQIKNNNKKKSLKTVGLGMYTLQILRKWLTEFLASSLPWAIDSGLQQQGTYCSFMSMGAMDMRQEFMQTQEKDTGLDYRALWN